MKRREPSPDTCDTAAIRESRPKFQRRMKRLKWKGPLIIYSVKKKPKTKYKGVSRKRQWLYPEGETAELSWILETRR